MKKYLLLDEVKSALDTDFHKVVFFRQPRCEAKLKNQRSPKNQVENLKITQPAFAQIAGRSNAIAPLSTLLMLGWTKDPQKWIFQQLESVVEVVGSQNKLLEKTLNPHFLPEQGEKQPP